MMKPQTLKGFRDFLPTEAKKRQYVISTLKTIFESYGFEPLETPALEYEEILTGKYGEEGDKLLYRFTDNGDRRVALRYDQTVPLSRVVAQYQHELPFPFKRYQIQPVWRAENTQKGRFREFVQCDIDTVGTNSVYADAETLALATTALQKLGFKGFKILINDRKIFTALVTHNLISEQQLFPVLRAVDKLEKIGRDAVLAEIEKEGITPEQSRKIIMFLEEQQPSEEFKQLFHYLHLLAIDPKCYAFSPTLARGLDYYTGLIFEIVIDGYTAGSVCGGGRYDNLIGLFAGHRIPAVGFAFGFDRLIDAMETLQLFPAHLQTANVLVTMFSPELAKQSIQAGVYLRNNGIPTEIYLDGNTKMEKQLKYANQKNMQFVIIIGPDEVEKNVIQVKNMHTREQKQLPLEEVIKHLQQ